MRPETPPYWLRYAGHFVRFGTLDPLIRGMAFAATAAVVLGLLVLTLPLERLAAVHAATGLLNIRMPWPVLAGGALLQAAGWWYLLAGAAMAGAAMRWPIALAFLLFFGLVVPGDLAVALPVLLTIGYLIYTAFRRPTDKWALAITGGLVVLTYLLLFLSDAAAVSMTLLNQVMVFYLLFIPIIFYSGFDLGQTGLYLTRFALTHAHRHLETEVVWWFALAIVGVKILILALTWQTPGLGVFTALLLIAVAAWACRAVSPREEEPPELLPFLAALLIILVVFMPQGLHLVFGWSALLALILAAVFLPASRRRPGWRAGAMFLLLFGLWNVSNVMALGPGNPVWGIIHGTLAIGARGMNEAVTLSALGYLLWLRWRHRLTVERALFAIFWLLGLTLALDTWNLFDWMHTLTRGLLSAEALLLIVGIGHEILASGGILNRGSRGLPRNSRVLLYLGYLLLLVGATVLANGTQGPTADLINTDDLQAGGLILIGLPLYLQQFLHAFSFGHLPRLEEDEA